MPAKKLSARKKTKPKVTNQHLGEPRLSNRSSAPRCQAGQNEAKREAAPIEPSDRASLDIESGLVSESLRDSAGVSEPAPTLRRECASEHDDQGAPEAGKRPPVEAYDKTPVEPSSPSEPHTAETGIDSSASPVALPAGAKSPTESKQARVLALLNSPQGATIESMAATTGWQAHSVRGFLTSVVRQKLGLNLSSEKIDGERRYRITHANPDSASSADQPSSGASQTTTGPSPASSAEVAE